MTELLIFAFGLVFVAGLLLGQASRMGRDE